MNRKHLRRLAAFAFLAAMALGSVACTASVGVGVSVPVYGGWGPYGYGPRPYGGIYVGGPVWP